MFFDKLRPTGADKVCRSARWRSRLVRRAQCVVLGTLLQVRRYPCAVLTSRLRLVFGLMVCGVSSFRSTRRCWRLAPCGVERWRLFRWNEHCWRSVAIPSSRYAHSSITSSGNRGWWRWNGSGIDWTGLGGNRARRGRPRLVTADHPRVSGV